jgi:hypothetical protein
MVRPGSNLVLNFVLSYPRVLGLIGIRAILAVALLVGPRLLLIDPRIICPVALLGGLLTIRNAYGQDGADQMSWILFTSLALVSLLPTVAVRIACLWFLALQGCLSYSTAGIAKATAKHWRDGTYLIRILGTKMYGNIAVSEFLNSRPAYARFVARLLIAWESCFPLILFLPPTLVICMLATGVLFHVANAYIMGLNTFFWSFLATYPAILYCTENRPW